MLQGNTVTIDLRSQELSDQVQNLLSKHEELQFDFQLSSMFPPPKEIGMDKVEEYLTELMQKGRELISIRKELHSLRPDLFPDQGDKEVFTISSPDPEVQALIDKVYAGA
jgi:hypothetical protein